MIISRAIFLEQYSEPQVLRLEEELSKATTEAKSLQSKIDGVKQKLKLCSPDGGLLLLEILERLEIKVPNQTVGLSFLFFHKFCCRLTPSNDPLVLNSS